MSRYAVGRVKRRVRMEWDDEYPLIPSITVDDHEAVDTGLITTSGEPIMRLPEEMGLSSRRRGRPRMSFWRPDHAWRGAREFWGLGERLYEIGMSPLSAKLVYGHINLFPELVQPANDTDGKRW